MLNPKQIHHVGSRQDFVDVVRNRDTHPFKLTRHQRTRSDQSYARAKFEQTKNIRSRYAAEEDVADDNDMKPGHSTLSFPDCVKIQERLGGMLMCPVTRINNARAEAFGQKLRSTGGTVPQNDNIGMVCLENLRCVLEGLTLCQAG